MDANHPIKVYLIDDQPIMKSGIISILLDANGIDFVGDGNTVGEFLSDKRHSEVNVILLGLSDSNALMALDELNKLESSLKTIIFSNSTNRETMKTLLKNGATGFVRKSALPSELVSHIKSTTEGSICISSEIIDRILTEDRESVNLDLSKIPLTRRQVEVLKLVAIGLTNQQIGEIMSISPRTVDTHRRHIMEKLDLHNAAALSHYAAKHGIVE
jgi:two-component system response regulator NreC